MRVLDDGLLVVVWGSRPPHAAVDASAAEYTAHDDDEENYYKYSVVLGWHGVEQNPHRPNETQCDEKLGQPLNPAETTTTTTGRHDRERGRVYWLRVNYSALEGDEEEVEDGDGAIEPSFD